MSTPFGHGGTNLHPPRRKLNILLKFFLQAIYNSLIIFRAILKKGGGRLSPLPKLVKIKKRIGRKIYLFWTLAWIWALVESWRFMNFSKIFSAIFRDATRNFGFIAVSFSNGWIGWLPMFCHVHTINFHIFRNPKNFIWKSLILIWGI